MSDTYQVEWLSGGILLQRRSGVLAIDDAKKYVAAIKAAIASAPERWGILVDTRAARAQTEEVQHVIQEQIRYATSHHVAWVAVVTSGAITHLQQRRITTEPGMHDPSSISFHSDYTEALNAVQRAVSG
jgi:hypothetical protein